MAAKAKIEEMTRAELREEAGAAGYVGARQLRRPDAERVVRYIRKNRGKAPAEKCLPTGIVVKVTPAQDAKPKATKANAKRRVEAAA